MLFLSLETQLQSSFTPHNNTSAPASYRHQGFIFMLPNYSSKAYCQHVDITFFTFLLELTCGSSGEKGLPSIGNVPRYRTRIGEPDLPRNFGIRFRQLSADGRGTAAIPTRSCGSCGRRQRKKRRLRPVTYVMVGVGKDAVTGHVRRPHRTHQGVRG